MLSAAILQFHETDFPGILLILHTIIKHEKTGRSILQQGLGHVPEPAWGQFGEREKVADRIVANRHLAL